MAILAINREASTRSLLSKYPCPESGDGVNRWYHSAFKTCAKFQVPAEVAYRVIESLVTRPVKAVELRRSMNKAYNSDAVDEATPVRHAYSPTSLKTWVDRLPFKMSSKWLIDNSPEPVNIGAGEFIEKIHPGRLCLVVHPYRNTGGFLYQGSHEREELSRYIKGNEAGVWYIANSVDGESKPIDWTPDGKVTRWSLRCAENLTGWDYAVLESDAVDAPAWCSMLVQQAGLPIVAMTYTGSSSVHALVRTGAKDRREFQQVRKKLIERFTPLGLDPAAVREVQLTRLPGAINGETKREQRLLWLNTAATNTPIWSPENTKGDR